MSESLLFWRSKRSVFYILCDILDENWMCTCLSQEKLWSGILQGGFYWKLQNLRKKITLKRLLPPKQKKTWKISIALENFHRGRVPFGWFGSGSVIQDYWWIMGDQRSSWIGVQSGFIGSFDAQWSEWSWITDPDRDHPKGTLPTVSFTDRVRPCACSL